jgi:HTH-type transcriptional regulator / antitoxin HigA
MMRSRGKRPLYSQSRRVGSQENSHDRSRASHGRAARIAYFEEKYYPLKAACPVEVLNELMLANSLKQKDLLDVFGTPSIISEVLRGKRKLTTEHIRRLSRRFHVSPEVFF